MNSPSASSNFCREPKDVQVSIHNISRYLQKMQLGSLDKILISSPAIFKPTHRGTGYERYHYNTSPSNILQEMSWSKSMLFGCYRNEDVGEYNPLLLKSSS